MPLAVIRSLEEWSARFPAGERAVLSVGNFDGLHLGHQKILRMVLERARSASQIAAAITFDPHPMKLLRPEQAPRMIQTFSQRMDGIEKIGLDAVLVLSFDRALSVLSPEEFIQRILVDRLHVSAILVGANFCFGHRGAGDVHLLGQFGKDHGYEVETVAPVEIGGVVVSSTAIRTAISSGNVADAIPLMGRPFSLAGEIRPGAGRGRAILFPTLNLSSEQELLPKLGVYATESVVGEKVYRSVTNIGTRPTFNGQGITVESHLFAFAEQVSSGAMEVRFLARIRDEKKFSGAEELRAQIARDIAVARELSLPLVVGVRDSRA
jgi:riboflavin kinase / FMN adenylyltransferase